MKKLPLIIMLLAIVGIIFYLESSKVHPGAPATAPTQDISFNPETAASVSGTPSASSTAVSAAESLPALQALAAADKKAGDKPAIEIADPTGFVNASSDFKLAGLIGKKVILVDFWTYSCINCIRTLPYLTAWYSRYRDAGLEIVGVHTPEFDFEKDINNVQAAAQKYGIKYPVVLDGNYGTWNAYGNLYWPHEYLIDLAGYIVHDQIGEGNYGGTEMEIQKLLAQRSQLLGTQAGPMPTSTVAVPQSEIAGGAVSPETYFGAARNEYLANGAPGKTGNQYFEEPVAVNPGQLYLIGNWNITPQYAETPPQVGSSQAGSDRIDYQYQAKGVYFVAGSADGSPIDVEVLRDGKPLEKTAAGSDVFYKEGRSFITISGNRLYRVIDDTASSGHFLEFIISKPGLRAYTFTFGLADPPKMACSLSKASCGS